MKGKALSILLLIDAVDFINAYRSRLLNTFNLKPLIPVLLLNNPHGSSHKKMPLGPEILRILVQFKELKIRNDLGLSPEQWQTLILMPVGELGTKLATIL